MVLTYIFILPHRLYTTACLLEASTYIVLYIWYICLEHIQFLASHFGS